MPIEYIYKNTNSFMRVYLLINQKESELILQMVLNYTKKMYFEKKSIYFQYLCIA